MLRLAARLLAFDNAERNWHDLRLKLGNYLTLVKERYSSSPPLSHPS